jgi:hypothetical protein
MSPASLPGIAQRLPAPGRDSDRDDHHGDAFGDERPFLIVG